MFQDEINVNLSDVNLNLVPDKYLSQTIVDMYWSKCKKLYNIPAKYITKDMVDEYWCLTRSLLGIPEECITNDMLKSFRNSKYFNISYIPTNLLTQEIVEEFFYEKVIYDRFVLGEIPTKFINKQMVEVHWETHSIFDGIPKKFITDEMVEDYLLALI